VNASCFNGNRKCKYLNVEIGFTNLNQKEAKEVYTCGKGIFRTTRDQKELPTSCKAGKMKGFTRISKGEK